MTDISKPRIPYNPRTAAQQAQRERYGRCVELWQRLFDDGKKWWNEQANDKACSGYNLFMANALNDCRAFYPFYEGVGTTIHDVSGYNHHATATAASWVDGGFLFPNPTDKITLPSSNFLLLTPPYSILTKTAVTAAIPGANNYLFSLIEDLEGGGDPPEEESLPPNQWNDPTGEWQDEPEAYDYDVNTWAYDQVKMAGWTEWVEYSRSEPFLCSGIKLYTIFSDWGTSKTWDIDIKYDDEWHDLYYGPPIGENYFARVDIDPPRILQNARFKAYMDQVGWWSWRMRELRFLKLIEQGPHKTTLSTNEEGKLSFSLLWPPEEETSIVTDFVTFDARTRSIIAAIRENTFVLQLDGQIIDAKATPSAYPEYSVHGHIGGERNENGILRAFGLYARDLTT